MRKPVYGRVHILFQITLSLSRNETCTQAFSYAPIKKLVHIHKTASSVFWMTLILLHDNLRIRKKRVQGLGENRTIFINNDEENLLLEFPADGKGNV